MAYTIKNSDGSTLLILADGKVDEKNTSISLIGKNVPNYGEYFNNNLIGLLENFSSVDEPRSPVVGQLWFDLSQGRLKVYTVDQLFKPVIGALISDQLPAELGTGDFWWDNINKQLKFFPNGPTGDEEIIGPVNSVKYGKTGWIAETVTDINGSDQYVTSLYTDNNLIGVMSDKDFDLYMPMDGLTSIKPGINLNPYITDLSDIRFVGTATSADAVQGIELDKLLRNDINQATTGTFSVLNNLGLYVGLDQDIALGVDTIGNGIIQHSVSDTDFQIRITNPVDGIITGIHFKSDTNSMGVWNTSPEYPVDIIGNTRVQGDLIVAGTTTFITSVNLAITDKNIELAAGQITPSDSIAAGGGITLHGDYDYQIKWAGDGAGWNVNDNLNLKSDTRTYTNLTPISTTGTSATFSVSSLDSNYIVTIDSTGQQYSTSTTASSLLTILGTDVGGETPTNDLTIVLTSVNDITGSINYFYSYGIAATQVYKINSSTVLTSNSLGSVVTEAPGLVRFGHIDYLNVGNMWIKDNTITSTGTDQTLYLNATGTGSINFSNKKITGVATPTAGTDAATKQYVDSKIQQRYNASVLLSLDITNFSAPVESQIISYLDKLMPIQNNNIDPLYQIGDEVFDLSTGTRIRVLCSSVSVNKPSTPLNLNVAKIYVDKDNASSVVEVLTAVAGTSTIQTLVPTVSYVIKQFRVDSALVWIYDGDVI